MTSSTTATPGVGTMQMSPFYPKMVSLLLNTIHSTWKSPTFELQFKFNNTNADSAEYGEESRWKWAVECQGHCRMDPVLNEDVILAVGEMIDMRFMLNLNGQWTNGAETCNGDCENLNVSLMKGGREVAVREYDSLADGENAIQWQLPVTEDLAYWNGSQESFTLEFRMVINSQAGGWFSAEDEAIFGLFYTNPNNAPEYNASVTFPILNETAVEELTGGGSSGGDDAGLLPGFTAMVGIGGWLQLFTP